MLWAVTKPENSGLYWLDIVHKGFYSSLFDENEFDDCFPDDFETVLDDSGTTKGNFESVYDKYFELDEPLKAHFQQIYNNHIDYKNYFSDINTDIESPTENIGDLWKAVKKLSTYLYSTTLGLVCFKNACPNNDDMDGHYELYKNLNGVVCCFCGTEEMMEEREIEPDDDFEQEEEKQWRASYDHYLPKKHYPFLSVDFDNLIPCCQKCNEKAKGEIDILRSDEVRTLALFPYEDENPVNLTASYQSEGEKLVMQIGIQDTQDLLAEKADTWSRAFKVIPRINKRLQRFNSDWLAPLMSGIDNVDNAREALRRESARCVVSKKQQREAFFRALCFDELVDKPEEDIKAIIDSVADIYSSRAGNL